MNYNEEEIKKELMKIDENKLRKLISENVKRVLREEQERSSIDDKIINLISFLHNAQLPVREIHWNTRVNALHLTTDEAIGNLFEWEDTLAEAFISDKNINLKINATKPSSSEDFSSIMKELVDLASDIKSNISDNKEYDRINAVIDEIIETSNKHLYRAEFK